MGQCDETGAGLFAIVEAVEIFCFQIDASGGSGPVFVVAANEI